MMTVADVKCYHCGYISGELSVEAGQPIQSGSFKPTAAYATSEALKGRRLRCFRCNGPVYLEDVRTVRPRPILTLEDIRPRRGRPRKAEVLARAS